MKMLARLACLLGLLAAPLFASEEEAFAAVRRADQQRIVATIASDAKKLGDLLSDDLVYGHADGRVQTKSQLITAVTTSNIRYLSVVPSDVHFQLIAPGAVAMSGRAKLTVQLPDHRLESPIRFLAVWHDEQGKWRLVAYQSIQLPLK